MIGPRTSLRRTAVLVGDALRKHGIAAVLTGGACAHVYAGPRITSSDVDFVLMSDTRRSNIDEALATLGFHRRPDRYVHPECRWFVEFPPGPLAIGADTGIRPVTFRLGRFATLALSATDSCRDRLAAFYHWDDRQSLEAAVEIARRHEVELARIRAWSAGEEAADKFREFERRITLSK